jgi:hypothetical protein
MISDRHIINNKVAMTLKRLQSQLLAFAPEEKAQAIQILTHSFNQRRGITKNSNVCGGNACKVLP